MKEKNNPIWRVNWIFLFEVNSRIKIAPKSGKEIIIGNKYKLKSELNIIIFFKWRNSDLN